VPTHADLAQRLAKSEEVPYGRVGVLSNFIHAYTHSHIHTHTHTHSRALTHRHTCIYTLTYLGLQEIEPAAADPRTAAREKSAADQSCH
jgi:hypothetical protein